MSLYSLFHPLVVYVVSCRVEAGAGQGVGHEVFYSHVMRELELIRKNGRAVPELEEGMEEACAYAAFYIDYMVHEGPFPFARDWQDLGRTLHHELAGDEKFFDYLRGYLEDDSALATDHLRLMHAMMNSGFSGSLRRRPVQLESLLRQVADRLGYSAAETASTRLLQSAPPSYSKPLHPRPKLPAIVMLLCMVGLLVLAFFFYLNRYRVATDELRMTLQQTQEQIEEEAAMHAHNTDSLVVDRYHVPTGGDEIPKEMPLPEVPAEEEPGTEEMNEPS